MGEADRYVSTGSLPGADEVRAVVAEAYDRYRSLGDGSPSTVYPALASADPSAFGVCVAGVNGSLHEQGDTRVPFTIMSVAKPFTFALACDAVGPAQARDRLGVDATGLAFNSVEAVERRGGRTNPMVNAGAIATVGLVDSDAETAWGTIRRGLSAFAGRDLDLDEVTLESARATNHRNRALAQMLKGYDALDGDAMAVHGLPSDAGGHGHRWPVRDIRRMALPGRLARQERHRGRDRHRIPRQGGPRHLLPSAGRGRQQRAGAVGGRVSG